jgi:single-strand DNA-binding protein
MIQISAAGASGENQSNPEAAGDGFMSIPDGIDEELPFN